MSFQEPGSLASRLHKTCVDGQVGLIFTNQTPQNHTLLLYSMDGTKNVTNSHWPFHLWVDSHYGPPTFFFFHLSIKWLPNRRIRSSHQSHGLFTAMKKKKERHKKQSLMRTCCPPHVFLLVSEYWVNQKTDSRFHLLSLLTCVLIMLKPPTYIKYLIVSVCFFSIFITCPISPLYSPLLPSLHQQRDSFNSPFNKEIASRKQPTWERWPCPRK